MPHTSHERDIFAISGLPPEVLAVALAKYSRSLESVKTTIDELTEEKSAEFHEKWVLGYGDASVADMAVVALALENVSILASKVIEDNRLASYQEKSTRYVPFDPTRYVKPRMFMEGPMAQTYTEAIELLMRSYETVVAKMIEFYGAKYARPEEMTEKAYAHKLRARALDVARYFLPTATLTNFGMVMSARALRNCISKLLANPCAEVRAIGVEVKRAAMEAAYNPQALKLAPVFEQLMNHADPQVRALTEEVVKGVKLQIKGAPTLIQFTDPKPYVMKKQGVCSQFVDRYFGDVQGGSTAGEARVDLYGKFLEPEDELVATLLYGAATIPFRVIALRVQAMTAEQKREIIDAVQCERGPHDNAAREFEVGNYFIFDTLMDYGAFRDLQRHRMTTQINQELNTLHGYEVPRDLEAAGLLSLYEEVMAKNKEAYATLAAVNADEARYVLAMAWRKRTIFKMNLRELYHFVELRSKSGGHFSYRALVYEMYEQVKTRHPLCVEHLRAVKMNFDEDFYKR